MSTGSGEPGESKASTSKDGQEARNRGGGGKVPPNDHLQTKFEGKCANLKGHIYDCFNLKTSRSVQQDTKGDVGICQTYLSSGGDALLSVENLAIVEPSEPDDPPEGATATKRRVWEKHFDEYIKRTTHMTEKVKSIFYLVWGQCTEIMSQKVKALSDFLDMSSKVDGIELLKAIKSITHKFQSQKYLPHAIQEAKRCVYMFSQEKMSTVEY